MAKFGLMRAGFDKKAFSEIEPTRSCSCAGLVCLNLHSTPNEDGTETTVPGRGLSQLLWVCDGVVVERETLRLESALSVGVVVSAEGLQTDLSGLLPTNSVEKAIRARDALVRVNRCLVQVREQIREQGIQVNQDPLVYVLQSVVGLGLTCFLRPEGPLLLFASGYSYYQGRRSAREMNRAFDSSFDEVISELERLAREQTKRIPVRTLRQSS